MDILHKELNQIYAAQCLAADNVDSAQVDVCKKLASDLAAVNDSCTVITDAACDRCYVFGGHLATLLGLTDTVPLSAEVGSSDEDDIYVRLHPEDLVEKRMLEYEFFRFINTLPAEQKLLFKATGRIRVRDRNDRYTMLDCSTQILRLSSTGKFWLILCCYDLSTDRQTHHGINPCIKNNSTGQIMTLSFDARKSRLLTAREKQILRLIRDGKLSKQISDILGISVHTVNRHRQNILEKLDVATSAQAVNAAEAMRLL